MARIPLPDIRFRTLWIALPAAVGLGVAGIMMAGPIVSIPPMWLGMTLHSATIAALWMLAGLIAPRTHRALAVVFLTGAALCVPLNVGFVHSVSVFYGLMPIIGACISSGLVWLGIAKATFETGTHRTALAIPAATATVLVMGLLMRPHANLRRAMWAMDDTPIPASVSFAAPNDADTRFVWTASAFNMDSMRVRLEIDPGSGTPRLILVRLNTSAERERACDAFRASGDALVSGEITHQVIPALIARLPHRRFACASGSFWHIAASGSS
jgi:hypothetical protein